jgi:hypothetical protein
MDHIPDSVGHNSRPTSDFLPRQNAIGGAQVCDRCGGAAERNLKSEAQRQQSTAAPTG